MPVEAGPVALVCLLGALLAMLAWCSVRSRAHPVSGHRTCVVVLWGLSILKAGALLIAALRHSAVMR